MSDDKKNVRSQGAIPKKKSSKKEAEASGGVPSTLQRASRSPTPFWKKVREDYGTTKSDSSSMTENPLPILRRSKKSENITKDMYKTYKADNDIKKLHLTKGYLDLASTLTDVKKGLEKSSAVFKRPEPKNVGGKPSKYGSTSKGEKKGQEKSYTVIKKPASEDVSAESSEISGLNTGLSLLYVSDENLQRKNKKESGPKAEKKETAKN